MFLTGNMFSLCSSLMIFSRSNYEHRNIFSLQRSRFNAKCDIFWANDVGQCSTKSIHFLNMNSIWKILLHFLRKWFRMKKPDPKRCNRSVCNEKQCGQRWATTTMCILKFNIEINYLSFALFYLSDYYLILLFTFPYNPFYP